MVRYVGNKPEMNHLHSFSKESVNLNMPGFVLLVQRTNSAIRLLNIRAQITSLNFEGHQGQWVRAPEVTICIAILML